MRSRRSWYRCLSWRAASGAVLCVGGAAMLASAGGRYARGAVRADEARTAWDLALAKEAVAQARAAAWHPASLRALADGSPVARLMIPRIDLDVIVLQGIDGDDLDAGPGHYPGSVLPGEPGNAIISAHRDRHFNHLDALDVGDTIVTQSAIQRDTWVVVATRVVGKDAAALFHTRDATLTLTTCWPIRYLGPAPDRLIVTAKPLRRAGARAS